MENLKKENKEIFGKLLVVIFEHIKKENTVLLEKTKLDVPDKAHTAETVIEFNNKLIDLFLEYKDNRSVYIDMSLRVITCAILSMTNNVLFNEVSTIFSSPTTLLLAAREVNSKYPSTPTSNPFMTRSGNA